MQNTQAGHSCPFGPRTIPGGQSPSSFLSPVAEDGGGGDDLEERSTGPLLAGVLFFVGGGDTLGEGTEDDVVSALEGRRGLNVVESGVVVGGGVGVGTVVAGLVLGGI